MTPENLNAFLFDAFQIGYYSIGEKVGQAWRSGVKFMKKAPAGVQKGGRGLPPSALFMPDERHRRPFSARQGRSLSYQSKASG